MEAHAAMKSRLIGAVLVEKGMITAEQLEVALEIQAKTDERLGEIVVAEFGVSRLELASVLAEQWAELDAARASDPLDPAPTLKVVEPPVSDDDQIRRPIGEIFVELGFISDEQLAAALAAQRETGARIGEILVEQGSLSRLDLASALAEQWSALQKLRPPAPVADPQPWQNGSPVVQPVDPPEETSSEAAPSTDLEERLRLIERATATSMTREDLDRVQQELRVALEALESRVDGATPDASIDEIVDTVGRLAVRLDAVESAPVADEVARLRDELEQFKSDRGADDTLAGVVAAIERLEERPDRADELAHLSTEIATLTARLDEIAGFDHLRERVDEAAVQARTAETGVRDLAERLDALGALESRLDDLATRMPAEGVLDELRLELSVLGAAREATGSSVQSDDLAELSARVEELASKVEHTSIGAAEALEPKLEELSVRVDEIAGGALEAQTAELASRLASLEELSRMGDDALDRLASELEERDARTHARLEELAQASGSIADLEEMRGRLDALGQSLERTADREHVDSLRARVEEIAATAGAGVDASAVEELRVELRSLSDRSQAIGSLEDQLHRLEARIAEWPGEEKLQDEVRLIAERVVSERAVLAEDAVLRSQLDGELGDIRSRLEALAAVPHEDAALRARVDEVVDRFSGIEAAVQSYGDLESGVRAGIDRAVAKGTGPLIERLESAESKLGDLAALEERLAGLAVALERQPDGERLAGELAEVGQRLDELAVVPHEDAALRERVDEMSARFAGLEASVEALSGLEAGVRAGIDRAVAKGTGPLVARLDSAESRLAAVDDLETRLSDLAATLERQPDGETLARELVDLRSRLDELAALPEEGASLRERVDSIAAQLAAVTSLEEAIAETRTQVALAEDVRVADALAHGARLAGVESSAASYLEMLAELDGRLSALAADLDTRLEDRSIANDVADLRGRIEHLAAQTTTDELGSRISALAERAEGIAHEVHSRLNQSSDELQGRLDGLDHALESRIEELAGRMGALVARDELDAAAARHVEWFQAELSGLRDAVDQRTASLEERIATVDRAREDDLQASRAAVGESVDAVRSELQAQHAATAAHLQEQLTAQGAALESARADREAEKASLARLESLIEDGLAALAARITDEVAGARTASQQEAETVRVEAASLGARIDEILGMRYVDLQAARAADERLAEQIEMVAELREHEAEAARAEAAALAARLEAVAGGLSAEAAAVRALAESTSEELADVWRSRADDTAAAGVAGAELAARIDDVAMRAAESVREVERGVRDELVALAARVEGHDAAEIEAREELRAELERLASSMGWRLERIEESLASDDSAALRETVSELERRLEGQTALGEEQAKATERALRKGLAALGERLVESQTVYVEAGNTLRRSIERLGAAVVEADARMADQIPVSPLEGCVAFAPTADGYRLIELEGDQPEVGAVIEVGACDGPLVVTRYGRSPLPFDGRPCAYLDRV